jgi:16S rRNA (cytidine1402-2'-O)-methyltransferase
VLYFIPTPIGNLEDISQRSLRLLSLSTTIFCEDTRITKRLLALLKERYALELAPKTFISFHAHNEAQVLSSLTPEQFAQPCVYVSDAGMPCISDPGATLVRYCQEQNIAYEVLPGANAALVAYVASGFLETPFSFFGFLPHKGREREQMLESVLAHPLNAILYESPHRIQKCMEELRKKAPHRQLFAIKEATKKYEKSFRGSVEEVAVWMESINLKGEWALVLQASKNENSASTLVTEDILSLSLPPKEKAKLLAKLTGENIKTWYAKLQTKH